MQKIKTQRKNNILFAFRQFFFFKTNIRNVLLLVFFCFCLNLSKLKADEELQYNSAIVVDANNGEILYSYNPDKKIYPASLTKMMTSYLVFSAIDNKIIGVNDNVKYQNKQIKIKDLIYKMAVNSYNDVTDILAKETYGDVNEFIKEMNDTAKDMNMKNTHFANTHGLFNENHYSTVRDMAKLSIRLVYDFPQYKDFFGTTNYIDENREYNIKTTKIQQNVKGMEGSKTGYTDTSKYNLATWGHYNGRHVFVVVSGLKDKKNRDKAVVNLLQQLTKDNTIKNSSKEEDEIMSKIFNFVGLDYNKYKSPKPIQREEEYIYNRKYRNIKAKQQKQQKEKENIRENKQDKEKISYFYKK